MWRQLSRQERRCFEVQNAAIPAIARMRLTGCPFDPAIHRETIQRWEIEHAENRAEFKAITGEEPPARDKVGRWLEAHLPAEEIAWMPRTSTGTVSARSDLLKHLAHHDEIRPLLRVLWSDKRLRSFGHKLIEAISPVTGRVHPDFMLGTKAGRLACSDAEFPAAAAGRAPRDRGAGRQAARGRRLLADRAARARRAERRRSAAQRIRARAVTCTGRRRRRSPASRSSRSRTSSARRRRRSCSAPTTAPAPSGIRATAWANFDVDLTLEQAGAAREAFLNRYPGVREYQQRQADLAEAAGVVRSVLGRPLKAEWEGGRISYTQAVNFPIQASAADVMLIAMAKVDRALPGAMVLQVHDELVLEVLEAEAAAAAAVLTGCMTDAYTEVFPEVADRRVGVCCHHSGVECC